MSQSVKAQLYSTCCLRCVVFAKKDAFRLVIAIRLCDARSIFLLQDIFHSFNFKRIIKEPHLLNEIR